VREVKVQLTRFSSDYIRIPSVWKPRSSRLAIRDGVGVEVVTEEVLVDPGVERSAVDKVMNGTKQTPEEGLVGDRCMRSLVDGNQTEKSRTHPREGCEQQTDCAMLSNQ
jgi:hypothetical protein